jgi:dsRNA-specific ribonuclease
MSSFDSNTDVDAIIDITAPPSSPIESLGDSTLVSSIYGSMAPLGFFIGIFLARVAGQYAGCRWVFYIGTILTSLTAVVAYLTILSDYRKRKNRPFDALPSKPHSKSTDILFDTYLRVAPRAIRDPISRAYISATFGYNFKNLDLLEQALDASGIYPDRPGQNKRMAMVGDSVIHTVLICDWLPWVGNFPPGQTIGKQIFTRMLLTTRLTWFIIGNCSDMLSAVESNANMAQVARRIGLDGHLVLRPSQRPGGPSPYMLATALEAVFGAINIDCGRDESVISAAMNKIGLTVASKDEAKANVEKAEGEKAK